MYEYDRDPFSQFSFYHPSRKERYRRVMENFQKNDDDDKVNFGFTGTRIKRIDLAK